MKMSGTFNPPVHGSPGHPDFDRPWMMTSQQTPYMGGTMEVINPAIYHQAMYGTPRIKGHGVGTGETGVTSVPAGGNGEPGSPDRAPAYGEGPRLDTLRPSADGTSEPILHEFSRRSYVNYGGRHASLRVRPGRVFQPEHAETQSRGRIVPNRQGENPNFHDGYVIGY